MKLRSIILLALALLCGGLAHAQTNPGVAPPFVILASGQSNFVMAPTFAWSPNANAKIWNWSGSDGNVGTAYVPLSGTTINITSKIASEIAFKAGRPVCLINIAITGQPISHWLTGTSSPDMFANITANIAAALTACGATKIDLFEWWQGEADSVPINQSYASNFSTMMSRFWADTTTGANWFPQETPVIVHGLASVADGNNVNANANLMNQVLQLVVAADPDKRRFVYTSALHGSTYWQAGGSSGHMTGQGYFSAGKMSANIYLNGPGRDTQSIVDPATGAHYYGNPAVVSSSVGSVFNLNAVGATLPGTSAVKQTVCSDTTTGCFEVFDVYNGGFAGMAGRSAGGTNAAPTAVTANQLVASYGAQIYDGSAFTTNVAGLNFYKSATNATTGDHGTYARINLTIPGTTTNADAFGFNWGLSVIYGSGSGTGGGTFLAGSNGGSTAWALGNASAILGGSYDATGLWSSTNGAYRLNWISAGFVQSSGNGTLSAGALTGDCAAAGFALTCTGINGVNQNSAWTSYTPTVTAQAGTFTTVSATGRYKQRGKSVDWQADVTITSAGTASASLIVTLPLTAAAFNYTGSVREHLNTGKSGAYIISASGTTAVGTDATGTTLIANGNLVVFTGTYEVP